MTEELSKRKISELLFTDTGDKHRARCNLCGNVYAVGSGLTNRFNHLKVHGDYVRLAHRVLTATDRAAELKKIVGELALNPPAPRRRGRPPKEIVSIGTLPLPRPTAASPVKKKLKTDTTAAPPSAATLPSNELMQLQLSLQSFQGTILSAVKTIQEDVNALRASVSELQNRDRLRTNQEIAVRAQTDASAMQEPLQRFIRTNKSYGGGITGGHLYQPPTIAVGAVYPSPPFPKSLEALAAMDRQQIHELAVLMDNDFGIESGDSIDKCREKVKRVLTGVN